MMWEQKARFLLHVLAKQSMLPYLAKYLGVGGIFQKIVFLFSAEFHKCQKKPTQLISL